MKWGIIGGGLAGLSVAYQLLERGLGEVHLYEAKEIGAGASGACTGLLHPFPGERANLSSGAREALVETNRLLKIASDVAKCPVAHRAPILRLAVKEGQALSFEQNSQKHGDLIFHACSDYRQMPALEILEGQVVYMNLYLKGLFEACLAKGLNFHIKRIAKIDELECDHTFICAGAGIFNFDFAKDLPIKQVKGQALLCEGSIDRALIGKGHITPTELPGVIQMGSTYEHSFIDERADLEIAKRSIYEKVRSFYPEPESFPIIECRAGIRVSRENNYLPLIETLTPEITLITAFGSRGLLYHAQAARQAIENRLSSLPCTQVFSF